MRFEKFSFSSIRIDGVTHEHDVVIDHGQVRKRQKNHPRNTGKSSRTRLCRSRRRFLGNVSGS